MIDFYGGEGTFASWPERVQSYAVATTPVNLLDWTSAYTFALTRELLGELRLPVLVAYGALSHPAVRRANALIADSVVSAEIQEVAGAAHQVLLPTPAFTIA